MTNLHFDRPNDYAMDRLSWSQDETEQELSVSAPLDRAVRRQLRPVQPPTVDDAALEGLRESDPEAYRQVVYGWA